MPAKALFLGDFDRGFLRADLLRGHRRLDFGLIGVAGELDQHRRARLRLA